MRNSGDIVAFAVCDVVDALASFDSVPVSLHVHILSSQEVPIISKITVCESAHPCSPYERSF